VPDSAERHRRAGDRHLRQGRLDEAAAQYRQALDANPLSVEAHSGLACCAAWQSDWALAIDELTRVVALQPDATQPQRNLGWVYWRQGQVDLAVQHYCRALELDPSDEIARDALAEVMEAADDPSAMAEARQFLSPVRLRVGAAEWRRLRESWYAAARSRRAITPAALFVAMMVMHVGDKVAGDRRGLSWAVLVESRALLIFLLIATAWLLVAIASAITRRLRLQHVLATYGELRLGEEVLATEIARELKSEQARAKSRVRAAETEATENLAREKLAGPAWWRAELSGAHLAYWLALAVLLATWALPGRVPAQAWGPALAIFIPGAFWKGIFWLLYGLTTNSARIGRLRFYRWWGRKIVPVVLALLPGLLLCLASYLGWVGSS
jgi:hypothetical protein